MEQAAALATTDNGNTTGCSEGAPSRSPGVVGAAQSEVSGAQLLPAAAALKPPDRRQPHSPMFRIPREDFIITKPRQRLLLPRPPPPSPPPPVLQAVTPPTSTTYGPPVSAAAAEGDAQAGQTLQSLQVAAHLKWQALQGTRSASDEPWRVACSGEVLRQVGQQQGGSSSMLRAGVATGQGRRGPVTAIRKGGFRGEGQRPHPHDRPQLLGAHGTARQIQSLGVPLPPPPLDRSIPSVAMPFFAPRAPPPPPPPEDASTSPLAGPAAPTHLRFHNRAAAGAAAVQQQSSKASREEGGIVALEDLTDDSQYWPYYMYDNDYDGASKTQSRSPLPPPGNAASGTLAVDRDISSQNGTGRSGAAAAAAIAAGCLQGREQAARRGGRPVRTCCLRRCSKKWPLEKLAQARSGIPAGVSAIHGPPPPDGNGGGGGGGGGGGDDGGGITVSAALRKAYLKNCFSRDGGLFYITGGRSSLPVCPLFFSAVTGIPAGVVESAVQEFLQGAKRRFYSRAPRASSIAKISARLAPSPSPGSREPVPNGWWYSTATERWYSRTTEPCAGIGADYSNHQLRCDSFKVIQAFITDLASHWQPLGESNRVEMSYPSRKAIYDLFVRDWERRWQDSVAEQTKNSRRWTPTPSYGVFVATWDRWCGHVGLKQSGQHHHEQEQHQQHQQYHHRHHYQEHQQLLQQQHQQQQDRFRQQQDRFQQQQDRFRQQQDRFQQQQDRFQQQHRHPQQYPQQQYPQQRHPQQQHPQQPQQQHPQQQQQGRQLLFQQWRHHLHQQHQQEQQQLQQLHNLFQQQQQQQQQQPRLQVPALPQTSMIPAKPTTEGPVYKAASAAVAADTTAAAAAAGGTAAPAAAAVVGGAAAEVEASEAPKPLAVPLLPAELQVDLAPSKSP